jgi:hypothetical protein
MGLANRSAITRFRDCHLGAQGRKLAFELRRLLFRVGETSFEVLSRGRRSADTRNADEGGKEHREQSRRFQDDISPDRVTRLEQSKRLHPIWVLCEYCRFSESVFGPP